MGQSQSKNPQRVAIVCPECQAELRPRVRDDSYKIRCPECSRVVRVPALSELAARRKTGGRPAPSRGQRASAGGQKAPGAGKSASAGRKRAGRRKLPVSVVCPQCQSRQDLTVSEEAEAVECQLCSAEIKVAIPGARSRGKLRPAPGRVPLTDTSRTSSSANRRLGGSSRSRRERRASSGFVEFTDEVREGEPLPPPPRWTFFSGVFTFPWHLHMLYRWIILSFFYTVTGWLIFFLYLMYTGGFGGFAMVMVALASMWFILWTLSYGAAWSLCIISDTASGNDRVVSPPEDDWREGVIDMGYVAYILIEAEVAAYFIGKAFAPFTEHHVLISTVTLFLIFPIVLLSSMEADSIWVPLTLPIVKSLGKMWWGWLLYYVLTGMLAAIWLAAFVVIMEHLMPISMFLLGPLTAAFVFISARLLGRLAWKVSLVL